MALKVVACLALLVSFYIAIGSGARPKSVLAVDDRIGNKPTGRLLQNWIASKPHHARALQGGLDFLNFAKKSSPPPDQQVVVKKESPAPTPVVVKKVVAPSPPPPSKIIIKKVVPPSPPPAAKQFIIKKG